MIARSRKRIRGPPAASHLITGGSFKRLDVVRARQRKPRATPAAVVVESDLPRLRGVLSWERELLLPLVQRLAHEALAHAAEEEQAVTKDEDGETSKQED